MSRPSSSCPNGCARLGPSNFWGRSVSSGLKGATSGAKTAITTNTAMTTVPKIASLLEKKARRKSSLRLRVLTSRMAAASCCTCASATSVPHPGIEDRIEYVHEQVDQHEDQGSVEDHTLYRSVVSAAHGLVGVQTDPGPREDRLGNDRSSHEQSHLQPYHRYRRQHGVSQGVLYDHPPRYDPLGPGRPHVVLVHDLQHAGASHPHHHRHGNGPEGQGGHYKVQ